MTHKRPLGFVTATMLVAASMIGVGVYTTSGFTLEALETPGRVIAAWAVAAVIALCGASGYASLASRFPESGGEYLFLSRSLHPVAGLMAGWVSLLAGFTGAIAIAAIGLGEYAAPLWSSWSQPVDAHAIAIAAVVFAAILHTVGVRSAAAAQNFAVGIKLALIAAFLVYAALRMGSWPGLDPSTPRPQAIGPLRPLEFANQLVWISFSFAGFNAAIYVSGEVADPERNVPRSLLAGTLVVSLVYLLLNAIFVLAPAAAVITADENVSQIAATAADAIGGRPFALLVRWVIILSLFTSVSAMVMTGPRVYAKMADDGFFPAWFRFEFRPPVLAIWFQALLAVVAISFTTLKELLGYLGLTLSICSALTVAMLFVLRARGDAVSLPWYGIPPAVYVIATSVLALLYAVAKPQQAIAAAATVVIGIALYPWLRKRIHDRSVSDDRPDPQSTGE